MAGAKTTDEKPDALQAIIDQIKKIQNRIDAMEAKGGDTADLHEKIEALNNRLNASPDFGSWD